VTAAANARKDSMARSDALAFAIGRVAIPDDSIASEISLAVRNRPFDTPLPAGVQR
jgi:hypothetical protein